ncbi:hypothetical protein [Anatilimnocola aggregata]|uniref:hypothetical protein n=1 Tax=Anatilimnocola aggregata TaxID=2528021 RepID=UPI00192E5C1B|nr:hypothetical protein [Anatilimnocola aggregata]
MFQRSFATCDLAQAHHVGLAQQNEHLHGLGHIRLLVDGLGDLDGTQGKCGVYRRYASEDESQRESSIDVHGLNLLVGKDGLVSKSAAAPRRTGPVADRSASDYD